MSRVVPLLIVAAALLGCADSRIATRAEPAKSPKPAPRPRPLPSLPRCPLHVANCAAARGTIVYVEAVDPDGDGDAHFVLTSRQSITLPGVSVIDVEKSLRPRRLPGVGDGIAAAGPVYRGSYGQRQIEATVLRVARR